MEFKDYYQILGLEKTATAAEIKKAYRKLARKYHPDVSKEEHAEKNMKEVNEAYAVLSDLEKRGAYDQLGNQYQAGQDFHPPPDWDAGFEFSGAGFSGADMGDASDFFASLFGHAARGRSTGGSQMRGEDHHAKIFIDLVDAYQGATRGVTLHKSVADAQGRVVTKEHTINVRIPKGVKEGQHIRLAGQGSPVWVAEPPVICIWNCISGLTRVIAQKAVMCMKRCRWRRGKRRWGRPSTHQPRPARCS